MITLLLALAIPSAHAQAADVGWQHTVGSPVRYAMEVNALTPFFVRFADKGKDDIRVPAMGMQVIATCTPKRALPKNKGWEMACEVEDASVFINPVMQDRGRSQPIAIEMEAMMEASRFSYRQHRNGQISVFNILGPTKDAIERHYLELGGLYVELGLATLDVPLYDDDHRISSEPWEHRPFRFAKLPIVGSTQGKIKATQRLAEQTPELFTYAGEATGGLMYWDNAWEIEVETHTTFERTSGQVIASEAHLRGKANAARTQNRTPPLSMDARLLQIPLDQDVPLKPSKGI